MTKAPRASSDATEDLIRAKVDLVQQVNAHLARSEQHGAIAITVQPNPQQGGDDFVAQVVNVSRNTIRHAASALCQMVVDELQGCGCGADHDAEVQQLREAMRLIVSPPAAQVLH